MAEGEGDHYNWVPSGLEALRLEDGRAVRPMGGERYEIGASGTTLHRVSRRSTGRGSNAH